jgi:hypothetical protein
VVLELTDLQKLGGDKSWGPQMKIVESKACVPGCKEVGGKQSINCLLCAKILPRSDFVTEICCLEKGGPICCHGCLVKQKVCPRHEHWWPGQKSLNDKLVWVGTRLGQVLPKCCVNCWKDNPSCTLMLCNHFTGDGKHRHSHFLGGAVRCYACKTLCLPCHAFW